MAKFLILDYTERGQASKVRINLDHLVAIQDIVLEDGSISDRAKYILSNGMTYDAPCDRAYLSGNVVDFEEDIIGS